MSERCGSHCHGFTVGITVGAVKEAVVKIVAGNLVVWAYLEVPQSYRGRSWRSRNELKVLCVLMSKLLYLVTS